MTAFIARTMNDWGMGLPGAEPVYWTGSFWSRDRKEAKRFKTREAIALAMGDWSRRGRDTWAIEEVSEAP